ncbi:MAG: hypothetical protein NC230_07235, partial [Bacteroides sp.]|nr:hypothetical protein [Bacteroides sp.]MCM1413914.1 hypothetical protein [Bacteroides sp.]
LTVARIKADYNSPYSITEAATLIRIAALERTELRTLLTKQDSSIISNQNVKELSLFDDFINHGFITPVVFSLHQFHRVAKVPNIYRTMGKRKTWTKSCLIGVMLWWVRSTIWGCWLLFWYRQTFL